ncbi:ATP-binding cassette domain-containing protein [Nocardia sp. NPDC048505]|uniref:ABC transporter ATP-binding protein n=1 Tax=Nocardia sp. NPDC048505 TaxID=3155756 RepID=UPI0033F6AB35
MSTPVTSETPPARTDLALSIEAVTVGYGGVPAVRDLHAGVRPGEILALLGPNGAGKTTTLLACVGALPLISGTIDALGAALDHRVERNARRGVILVPDSRGVFHRLSVEDNLRLARRKNGPSVDDVFDYFPALRSMRARRCGTLSGGEQQMLALAKALLCAPRILLVDELSLGLSPIAVEGLLPRLREIADDQHMAVVLVEQHIELAFSIADSAVVLHHGRAVISGSAAELGKRRDMVEAAYFGTTQESTGGSAAT